MSLGNPIVHLLLLLLLLLLSRFSHVWRPVQLFATPWIAACQAFLSFTIFWSLLKLMFIESVMPSNHLTLCGLLLLLPSVFPSIRVLSNELALHIRWPKYWSFSFSITPSNEYSGLIPFRIKWFDLLEIQGTLKSLFQHHRKSSEGLIYSEVGGEGDDRGWDGWIASLTQWTWVWANSGRWWRTGKPGVLQFTGSQRVGHDWATVQHCNNTV